LRDVARDHRKSDENHRLDQDFAQADREDIEEGFRRASRDNLADEFMKRVRREETDPDRVWRMAVTATCVRLGVSIVPLDRDHLSVRLSLHGSPMVAVPVAALEKLREQGAHPYGVGHMLAAVAHDERFAWWGEGEDG